MEATAVVTTTTRPSIGKSDPVSYTCTCGQPEGSVLLFYRYFANNPKLPVDLLSYVHNPEEHQARFHRDIGQLHNLTGKIRVSTEGFNVTVAGSHSAIAAYIAACVAHWSFRGLDLVDLQKQDAFFKPGPGCACVFADLKVRTTAEITPLGVTNYSPATWSAVQPLSPAEFHRKCWEENVRLVDVRNHYESRIGYFVSPKGGEAVKPPLRRFSQWPQWVKGGGLTDIIIGTEKSLEDENNDGGPPPVLTYCTGGIRCEKGVRWMEEYLRMMNPGHHHRLGPVYTLEGGIAAYMTWMEAEIAAGRKLPDDTLFKGQNYVFDARGCTGIETGEPVSCCHVCGVKVARLGKCATEGCHLVLVICDECERTAVTGGVRCCEDCLDTWARNKEVQTGGPKSMCRCEREREKELWGDGKGRLKGPRTQGPRTQGPRVKS
ncbi:hypothetical protein B0H66DRAFT_567670 [Apodospora peruviana]|uniref:Rhodanese domain-containing protein n=1 Tax=Apodospora peruviana TaxID=516989 RepID=A0AAE0HWU2_9PEZI|nr:hypothetical protein B0H66DRAFT_567670 [Apodospora peruviana]